MNPIQRIEHIRQCLRRMNPVLGSELAGAAAIEKELQALELIFTLHPWKQMTRDALNGDPCV